MTRWTERLRRFFFISNHSGVNLSLLSEIDPEIVAAELAVKAKAANAAHSELPGSQAGTADGTEREIRSYFEKRMAKFNALGNEKLSRINTSIVDTNLEDERAGIKNQSEHIKLEFKSMMTREFRFLHLSKQERDETSAEFARFREQHGLLRAAHYPESQILYIAFILCVWLIESVCNGYFFAKGSEFGLLGGVMQATLIAAINVATAFFIMGSLSRYKNHMSLWKRGSAYGGLLIYSMLAAAFNLLVAHYRDIYASQAELAGKLAVQRFMQAPFALADFDSWLLFFLGLLFALFALVDGYKRDDPYPGYGRLHRRLTQTQQRYEEFRVEVVQQAEALRRHFLSRLERMQQNVQTKHTRLVHLVEEKQAFVNWHQHVITNFINTANALIHQYREENMAVRKTPAPAYFNDEWQPVQSYVLRGDQDDQMKVDHQQSLYQEFPGYAQQRANEIEMLYVNFFAQLHAIDPTMQSAPTAVETTLT